MQKFLMLLCLLPAFAIAQQYYEASGQTMVFTLAAGAKAGAGSSAVLFHAPLTPIASPHMLVTVQNGIHIRIPGFKGIGRVFIYSLEGRTIQTAYIDGSLPVALWSVPRGVYFARFEVNGRVVQTTRFWKAR